MGYRIPCWRARLGTPAARAAQRAARPQPLDSAYRQRAAGRTAEADFNQKWNERCLAEDPALQREVKEIIKWVNEYKLPPGGKLFLKQDIQEQLKKEE